MIVATLILLRICTALYTNHTYNGITRADTGLKYYVCNGIGHFCGALDHDSNKFLKFLKTTDSREKKSQGRNKSRLFKVGCAKVRIRYFIRTLGCAMPNKIPKHAKSRKEEVVKKTKEDVMGGI